MNSGGIMRLLFLLLLLHIGSILSGIDLNLPASAVHNAANNLNLIYPTPASMSMNPSVYAPGLETSATYLFNLTELPKYDLHFVLTLGDFRLYLGDTYLDHEFYLENAAMLGMNYTFSSVTAGFNLRRLSSKVEGYREAISQLLDGGISWQNGRISSSLALRNITQSKLDEEKLPVFYLWESCFDISEKGRVSVGFEKQDRFDFSLKFAGRFDLFQMLSLISSYQSEPARTGIGIIFMINKFKVIYSVRTHQHLGINHYISVNYEIFN